MVPDILIKIFNDAQDAPETHGALCKQLECIFEQVRIQLDAIAGLGHLAKLCSVSSPSQGHSLGASCSSNLVRLVNHDQSVEVRRSAFRVLHDYVDPSTALKLAVERARDMDEDIRRFSLTLLVSTAKPVDYLAPCQCLDLLTCSLQDRSSWCPLDQQILYTGVRQQAQSLLHHLLTSSFKDNPVILLKRLSVDLEPSHCESLLDVLLLTASRDRLRLLVDAFVACYLSPCRIPKQDFRDKPEVVFFWRYLAKFAVDKAAATFSSSLLLPTLTDYVALVKSLVIECCQLLASVQRPSSEVSDLLSLQFVIDQCCCLGLLLDFSSPSSDGFRQLKILIDSLIVNPRVPALLANQLIKLHSLTQPNLVKRIDQIVELTSELCDPDTDVDPVSQLEFATDDDDSTMDVQKSGVPHGNDGDLTSNESDSQSQSQPSLLDDCSSVCLHKACKLIAALLDQSLDALDGATPSLRSLLYVLPFEVESEEICQLSIQTITNCLVLFGVKPFYNISLPSSNRADSEIEALAASVRIIDGRQVDSTTNDDNTCNNTASQETMTVARLIKPMVDRLTFSDAKSFQLCIKSLAKLHVIDRIGSISILAHFIASWLNHSLLENDGLLRVFFTEYVSSSTTLEVNNCQVGRRRQLVADAIVPSLDLLVIDDDHLIGHQSADLMDELTDRLSRLITAVLGCRDDDKQQAVIKDSLLNCHQQPTLCERLAFDLCNAIVKSTCPDADGDHQRLRSNLCIRLLLSLRFHVDELSSSSAAGLLEALGQVGEKVAINLDKRHKLQLKAFKQRLIDGVNGQAASAPLSFTSARSMSTEDVLVDLTNVMPSRR